MSLQACADLLAKGDPDRFAAVMAAPVAARQVLFPLYAFNQEVARAPWATSEPMIAEMRLQWWRDVLEEIRQGAPARAHEVVQPLAAIVTPDMVPLLDRLIEVRRWDIYKDPFRDAAHFHDYLTATGGGLMQAAALGLGAQADLPAMAQVKTYGAACALARFLRAIPELESRGRIPLTDGTPAAVQTLARDGLNALKRPPLRGLARAALNDGWPARAVLGKAARRPALVARGGLNPDPLARSLALLRLGLPF